MSKIQPIPVRLNSRAATPTTRYFAPDTQSVQSSSESNLLKAIRTTLQGSRGDSSSGSSVASLVFSPGESTLDEEELCWDNYTVIHSCGGVIQRKWSFKEEGQPVQWACIGWLEQPNILNTSASMRSAHYTSSDSADDQSSSLPDPNQRPTFGPFTRVQPEQRPSDDSTLRSRAVFIFLRSLGKVFFLNGLEYTFYLPFIVRRAWPLSPHGVMLQRALEPGEVEEAAISHEELLPTIFTMVNPFAEASAVGLTTCIRNGTPQSIDDDDPSEPTASIPAQEHVLWVSGRIRNTDSTDLMALTINMETKMLSVWRYTYVNPKDYPHPHRRSADRPSNSKHRQSLSGVLSPRQPSYVTAPTRPYSPPEPLPLASLPGLPPALNSTMPMAALVPGAVPNAPAIPPPVVKGRRNSLGQHDVAEQMITGGRAEANTFNVDPVDHARMRPAYWMERLYSEEISQLDVASWQNITCGIFDRRWDGSTECARFAVCLPSRSTVVILPLLKSDEDKSISVGTAERLLATSVAPIRALRFKVLDLLMLKPDGTLSILTHGTKELPLKILPSGPASADASPIPPKMRIVTLKNAVESSVTLCHTDGTSVRVSLNLIPRGTIAVQCLLIFALVIPAEVFFTLHHRFLLKWSAVGFVDSDAKGGSFYALRDAIYEILGIKDDTNAHVAAGYPSTKDNTSKSWEALSLSSSASRFLSDPALNNLLLPPSRPVKHATTKHMPHQFHSSILSGLHHVAQGLLLATIHHEALMRLVPVICKLALPVRPEWADYWKRLFPHALGPWPSPAKSVTEYLDDRLPVWPPDIFSSLYARINNPDWDAPEVPTWKLIFPPGAEASFAFGSMDPLACTHQVTAVYQSLADGKTDCRKRAQAALKHMVRAAENSLGLEQMMERLPLGLAAPLREAARTCQLSPSGDWPVAAYQLIGRNDLAEGANNLPGLLLNNGYRSVKDYLLPTISRKSINEHGEDVRLAISGELAATSGVELDIDDFTEIRFGQDKRVEEVARMLCSSTVPAIKAPERPDLNEHDIHREHQAQVGRLAERTLALPLGRAIFTFGSVQVVTREAFAIPKLEFSIRVQPQNLLIVPENGKIPMESSSWGEFHNGVAAGLRISPSADGVESSWIKFNKPSELTPEHAGFLFALGLTGHLREMLTWHTFAYLTPKHDLTSIAVLLGLSAANAGTSNRHVTKLLAVHTPALLPTPSIDLNVPLVTQASGIMGVGLLYMGTRNRRMAEVCLSQISRKDLVQQDLSNEYREAYTLCAALAFGMVMLGKGSHTPADLVILSRLRVLVHGEGHSLTGVKPARPSFDINLTSPAATMALGLMYLRTERQDVADILSIPDTTLALDRIQPNFLLLRTLGRALILWDGITPTTEWLSAQVPLSIAEAMEKKLKGKSVHESFELAYYNIVSGCCFAIALKYAGTAREEAYALIIRYYDQFSQMTYGSGPQFDHRIKRAAIRDGLNLISIALNMVMAGTGEINCLRRLRYSYGMLNQLFRYGTYGAIHISLGLLFLGGGRYTLGTSDAAIACMVTAFFPRFAQVSSDNKSYLQALRHLWVLAIEPRCLITRDVDTKEVVYLPVKIKVKDSKDVGTTQLIAPTLIPDIDKLLSIRVDTPRYWPFYLDIVNLPHHKESLIRSQTLFVKRRTAFLSYMEDPKGSRSLFVRSGSSTADAATLDFPRLKHADTHPATDLHHFISSHSNDVLFLAFADRFCRNEGQTDEEKLFHAYCHATLLDSILQDKSRTMQSHLTLYRYRKMSIHSPYFGLAQQDLRFAAEFYGKIFERRFSGRSENNPRPPLIRESTLHAALHELDQKLEVLRSRPSFRPMLREYARGSGLPEFEHDSALQKVSHALAWYLQRNSVPVSTLLVVLKALAVSSHGRCLKAPPPHGTTDVPVLDEAIKAVLHATGTQLMTSIGSGWSVRSVEEILETWHMEEDAQAISE